MWSIIPVDILEYSDRSSVSANSVRIASDVSLG